jgi:hypothetical protein
MNKSQFLKIAKVKTFDEFYAKFPTEEAFMKMHGQEFEQAKSGIHIKPSKKGTFTAAASKHGKGVQEFARQVMANKENYSPAMVKKANFARNAAKWHHEDGGEIYPIINEAKSGIHINPENKGKFTETKKRTGKTTEELTHSKNPLTRKRAIFAQNAKKWHHEDGGVIGSYMQLAEQGINTSKAFSIGDLESAAPIVGDVMSSIQEIKKARDEERSAKQFAKLSDITLQAANSRPEQIRRHYLRPEDQMVEPGQLGTSYGVGTNYLAKNGTKIGGNKTEIQNSYDPYTIYDDLGYVPVAENGFSSFMGNMGGSSAGNIGSTLGSFIGGGQGAQSGAGKLGSTIGGTVGKAFGPVGEAVGAAVGGLAGGIIGGGQAKRTRENTELGQMNLGMAAMQNNTQNLQKQYSTFMEEGGYVNPEYNPQLITKFGNVDVTDVHNIFTKGMNTLRTGGSITQNYNPDYSIMEMGGELETHWGGEAEPMSYNPYLPGDGETVMFNGQSHDETDSQGRSGIGITYGQSPVEVEGGEPAMKMQNGGEEDSLVVFGNMKIPKYGVDEIGDKNAKGKKFKHYVKDLSEQEMKQNKLMKSSSKLANDVDENDPFERLKLSSAQANLIGADMNLKNIAKKKQAASNVQNAILDTAEEFGLVSDELAKGKIKKAQKGMKVPYANQSDPVSELRRVLSGHSSDIRPMNLSVSTQPLRDEYVSVPTVRLNGPMVAQDISSKATVKNLSKEDKWEKATNFINSVWPYMRPSNKMGLDPSQLAGEMQALATNQLEPVQAQMYTPELETSYSISLQDQLNQNQATFNALLRQGANPNAAAAQKYQADQQVLANQFRANQESKMGAFNRNRQALNDAKLKNLSILDQQYTRQAQAKSNTKAIAQAALNSVASKIAQNKLENRNLGVYENLYNYRFGPNGQIYNANQPAGFMIPQTVGTSVDQKPAEKDSKKSRNGSIVKALKNF